MSTITTEARQTAPEAAGRERQPREHPVPCQQCRRMTWAISAVCEAHHG